MRGGVTSTLGAGPGARRAGNWGGGQARGTLGVERAEPWERVEPSTDKGSGAGRGAGKPGSRGRDGPAREPNG